MQRLLLDKSLAKAIHMRQQQEVLKYDIELVGQHILDFYTQSLAKRRKTVDNELHV